MKKKLLLVPVMLFIAVVARGQAVYTITDSSLTKRPVDLLQDDIRFNRASTDDFTYWLSNGLYGFYGPQPKVLVDGLPVDVNYFGWQNLNMLPVQNVQKFGYSLTPQTYKGIISPAGFINFKSRRVDKGLSVATSFYLGNETGDPGPYNYDTTKVTPNVDRWGPNGEFSLSYRKSNWYARGNFAIRDHKPTDLALNARLHFTASLLGNNKKYVNHIISEKTHSGLLETGYQSDNWQFKIRSALGNSNDYLFLQPLGREVPARTAYQQIAAEGDFQTGRWNLSARYIAHRKTINRRYNPYPPIFDWDQRTQTVGLGSSYSSGNFRIQPGISYQRLNTKAPGLGTIANDLINLSVGASIKPVSSDSVHFHFNTDYDEKNVAKTFGLSITQKVIKGWKIIPSVEHSEVLPLRQNSFSYWVNRGYTFASFLGISYNGLTTVGENQLTYYKIENRISVGRHIVFKLAPRLIHHQSLNIPYQQVKAREAVTDTQPGPFTITQEKGNRFQLYGQLSYSLRTFLGQSLALNIQRTLSGSERYKNYFEQIPDTKVQYKIRINPIPDLQLSARALYRSSTTWDEFDAIEGNKFNLPNGIPIRRINGTFHTTTPAYTDISLGLKKWLWNRRLNTQINVENLLNREERLHTLGADLSTKFDIKINLNL